MNSAFYTDPVPYYIFALLLEDDGDKWSFVGKSGGQRISAVYSRHICGNVAATEGFFTHIDKPGLYILEDCRKAIYDFHRCWLDLLSYAEERNEKYFSVELGEKYLLERRGIDVLADESTLGLTRSMIRPYKRAIYLLADLQKSGVVLRKRRMERTEVPACFAPILEHYLVMARSRYNSEGTVAGKEFIIKQFLLHVDQKNIQDLKQLTHQDITSFLETTVTWARRTVATTICYLRQFISFLYEEEYIEIDLAKGIVGLNETEDADVQNCYSAGQVYGAKSGKYMYVGAVVGRNQSNDGYVANCYYLKNSAKNGEGDYCLGGGTSTGSEDYVKNHFYTGSFTSLTSQIEGEKYTGGILIDVLNAMVNDARDEGVSTIKQWVEDVNGYPVPDLRLPVIH